MIVYDLYVQGVRFGPSEADAVLIVDPDAVLPFSVALQGLQVMTW